MLGRLPPLPPLPLPKTKCQRPPPATVVLFKPPRDRSNFEEKVCDSYGPCSHERPTPTLGHSGGTYQYNKKYGPYTPERASRPRGCKEVGTEGPKRPGKRLPPLGPSTLFTLKGHTGPYNTMWDPHVCRGSNVMHFDTADKLKCSEFREKHDKDKIRNRVRRVVTPLLGGFKGMIKHPSLAPPVKNECTDFSMFLEEQESNDADKVAISTQTEEDKGILSDDSDFDKDYRKTMVKNEWKSGVEIETQCEWGHIASEVRASVGETTSHPRNHTMSRLAKIISSQVLCQGILETLECEELELIRGECESINLWIAQDQRRKFREKREACKRLNRIKSEEKSRLEEEAGMSVVVDRVAASYFSRNYISSLMEGGLGTCVAEGITGSKSNKSNPNNPKAKARLDWIDENVGIVFKNKKLARNLVDDVLVHASMQRNEDNKAFLDRPDISSSLVIAYSVEDIEKVREDEDLNDVDVAGDNNTIDNEIGDGPDERGGGGGGSGGNEGVEGQEPQLIKLMEPNPHFTQEDDD